MQRRTLIALLGGAAAWPLATRPQQKAMPVVGYLGLGSPGSRASILNAFREGLNETGYVEGRTSRSNIAGRRVTPNGSGLSWPNQSRSRSMSS
jgi:hypothetical protein